MGSPETLDCLLLAVAEHYGITADSIRFSQGKEGTAAVRAARQALARWLVTSARWPVSSVAALLDVAHVHVRRLVRAHVPVPRAASEWPRPAPGARRPEAKSLPRRAARLAARTGLPVREVLDALRAGRTESDFG